MSTPVSGANFSAGYVPPGVYVSTKSTGSTGATGIGDTVVCLVGRGVGHRVYTEGISFANGDTVTLRQQGINPAPVPFTVSDSGKLTYGTGGSVLVTPPGVGQLPYAMDDTTHTSTDEPGPMDYSIAQSTDSDANLRTTTITRTPGGNIGAGANDIVLVRYHYTDGAYYQLHSFTDYATFTSLYGPALDPSTGEVNSPLSLAAQFAFNNGANIIYAVAVDTTKGATSPEQFDSAYALTVPNYDINLMVPLWEDATDQGAAINQLGKIKAFLNSAASTGFPRIALCAPAAGYSGDDPSQISSQTAFKRIVWVWPHTYTMFNPVRTTNGAFEVGGYYAAAAAAGFLANNDPNQGLTATQLQGFTGLPSRILTGLSDVTAKNFWSSSGVTIYEQNRLGQLVCRHGVTTDPSDVGTFEISLVRCQDALFVEIELTMMEAGLIGTPITVDTTLMVKSMVTGALEAALSSGTIASYDSVVAAQQHLPAGDPTVIECSFNYQPTYPLNYITVTFTLDLSTGNISNPITDTAGGGGGLPATG